MDFVQQKKKRDNITKYTHSNRQSESIRTRNAVPKVRSRAIRNVSEPEAPVQCCPPKKAKKQTGPVYTRGYDVTPIHSTPEERVRCTPSGTHGRWIGGRGNSTFISNDPRVAEFFEGREMQGIEYQSGMPDFSPFARGEVEIEDMGTQRYDNFQQADRRLAEQQIQSGGELQTEEEVAAWRKENGFTWHELNDARHMQMVPSKINAPVFKHLGGVGELNIPKRRKRK